MFTWACHRSDHTIEGNSVFVCSEDIMQWSFCTKAATEGLHTRNEIHIDKERSESYLSVSLACVHLLILISDQVLN